VPVRHQLVAAFVAVVWGANFIAVHASLEHYPPLLLLALRWLILAVPTLIFVPRPKVALRYLLIYALTLGTMEFVLLYWAMAIGMPAGLASLVLQSSAPLTVILGAIFMRERLTGVGVLGVVISALGLTVVGLDRGLSASLWPFVLTVLGGLGWALGNLAARAARPDNAFHFTMWMTTIPPLPLLAMSWVYEGPDRISQALSTAPSALNANLGLLFTSLISSLFATTLWSWLMARHPASVVAPWSMAVPVVGLATAWLILDESVSLLAAAGCALVIVGVLSTSVRRRTT